MPRLRREDPRVARSRAAALAAARTCFLRDGYAATTMEDIAAAGGLTRRTLYNNYRDKAALFLEMVEEAVAFAEAFARELPEAFAGITSSDVERRLDDLGVRLARGIVRAEVVALRRMLIGDSRAFPRIARRYFDRAPGQVLRALESGFAALTRRRLLRASDAASAAAQFAYLVAGAPLDRALMTGTLPPRRLVDATARDGVATFLARYMV